MPAKKGPEGVELSAAILGRNGAKEDRGNIGKVAFEANTSLKAARIFVDYASFGAPGAGIQEVGGTNGVEVLAPGHEQPVAGSGMQPPPGSTHGDHPQPGMNHQDDDRLSPEEIKAMDNGMRKRINRLPRHLQQQAKRVHDMHMKLLRAMDGEADERLKELGLKTFDAAIRFLDKLATDSRAVQNKAVHELIHFIHNDFGEGDVPRDIPTRDMIYTEIGHLKGERDHFVQNFKRCVTIFSMRMGRARSDLPTRHLAA